MHKQERNVDINRGEKPPEAEEDDGRVLAVGEGIKAAAARLLQRHGLRAHVLMDQDSNKGRCRSSRHSSR